MQPYAAYEKVGFRVDAIEKTGSRQIIAFEYASIPQGPIVGGLPRMRVR